MSSIFRISYRRGTWEDSVHVYEVRINIIGGL